MSHPEDIHSRVQHLIAHEKYGELVALASKHPTPQRSHIQLVALIRLERYQDALRLLDSPALAGTGHAHHYDYERAYCLYRTNKLTDALALLQSLDTSQKTQLLKAQVLYRLERFDQCLEIYQALIDATPADDDDGDDDGHADLRQDLITNHQAVLASSYLSTLAFTSPSTDNSDSTVDSLTDLASFASYEHCYNTATTALAQGHLPLALAALHHARRLATLSLADSGLSQRDLAIELQPVLVQLAYAYHLAGDLDQAAQLYRVVIGGAGAGAAAAHTPDWAVAVNNLASIEALAHAGEEGKDKDKEVQRRFKRINKHAAVRSDRMPRWQRNLVAANEALVNGFFTGAGAPDDNIVLQTMRALAAGKPLPDTSATDDPLAQSVFVTLAHAQRKLESASSADQLAATLNEIDAASVPALAALHARVLASTGNVDAAIAILESIGAQEQVARLLAQMPDRRQDAASVWAGLVAQDPGNVRRVAEWVKAEALVDPQAAEEHAGALAVDGDEDDQDDEDVDTAWKALVATTTTTTAAAPAAAAKEKTKKRRRPRLPKGADPTSPEFQARVPDPERWVPKHLRKAALAAAAAAAKKKGGAKRAVATGAKGAHQGGAVADDPNPAPVMTGLGGTGSARIFGSRGGQAQQKERAEEEMKEAPVEKVVQKAPSKPAAGNKKKGPAGKKGGRK